MREPKLTAPCPGGAHPRRLVELVRAPVHEGGGVFSVAGEPADGRDPSDIETDTQPTLPAARRTEVRLGSLGRQAPKTLLPETLRRDRSDRPREEPLQPPDRDNPGGSPEPVGSKGAGKTIRRIPSPAGRQGPAVPPDPANRSGWRTPEDRWRAGRFRSPVRPSRGAGEPDRQTVTAWRETPGSGPSKLPGDPRNQGRNPVSRTASATSNAFAYKSRVVEIPILGKGRTRSLFDFLCTIQG